jgi:hypothetical protein
MYVERPERSREQFHFSRASSYRVRLVSGVLKIENECESIILHMYLVSLVSHD